MKTSTKIAAVVLILCLLLLAAASMDASTYLYCFEDDLIQGCRCIHIDVTDLAPV